jgi:hypothetical protein
MKMVRRRLGRPPRKQQDLGCCFGQPSPKRQAPAEGTKAKAANPLSRFPIKQPQWIEINAESGRVIPFLSFPFLSFPFQSAQPRITHPSISGMCRDHTRQRTVWGGDEEAALLQHPQRLGSLTYVVFAGPCGGGPRRLDPSRALDRFSRSTGLALQIGLLIQVFDGHQFVKPAAARALFLKAYEKGSKAPLALDLGLA